MSDRYQRQISLFGEENQAKLAAAHVAVIGAGGLGSPALLYLAGAGIGRITLIDDDTVALSNLHRQVIHRTGVVGSLKTESAAETLHDLNPDTHLTLVSERLNWDNALAHLEGANLVLDGTDNFDTRHIASAACARLGIPHIWGSILGFEAQMSVFWAGHGPIYEDLFPTPPGLGEVPSCAEAGVLGPVVGVVGCAMTMEALKLITGLGEPLIGRLGYFDSLTGMWEYVPVTGSPTTLNRVLTHEPPRQSSVVETDTIPDDSSLIDVRSPQEFASGALPGAVNIPLDEILAADEIPTPAVVYCASGARSKKAIAALEERGVSGLTSLRGGLERFNRP